MSSVDGMGENRKNATERRLSHVRALKEQFFSEHEADTGATASELQNRIEQLDSTRAELVALTARLRDREAELASREALIHELEHELEQLRVRLTRRRPLAETRAPETKRRPADDAPRFDFYTND